MVSDEPDCLFAGATARLLKPAASLVPRCGDCGFKEACRSPKIKPTGGFRKRILVVGEFPDADTDRVGEPFTGPAGQFLSLACREAGFSLRTDCRLTDAVICRPPNGNLKKAKKGNPVDHCRPTLLKTLTASDPFVVILLGNAPVRSLLGHLWGVGDPGNIGRWAGFVVPARHPNCWVCPTFHPTFLQQADDQAANRQFVGHLARARELADSGIRPWETPPDYTKRIECIHDPEEAATRLRKYTGGEIAFDFETDRLKPDQTGDDGKPISRIVCASVCWEGQETIAFPWHGPVRDAMRELLVNSDVAKVGWNMTMEHRWTLAHLGVHVKGWSWDGMLASHALDPRGGVTGLKFQAFARLGQPTYNAHVEPYLAGADGGGNTPNRIHEVGVSEILSYCGTDSLLEYMVSRIQQADFGLGEYPEGRGWPARV